MGQGASTVVSFDDNSLLPIVYGQYDQNLARIEHRLGVMLRSRGNEVTISGPDEAIATAHSALKALYDRAGHSLPVDVGDVDAAIRFAAAGTAAPGAAKGAPEASGAIAIDTRKRQIGARTPGQAEYIRALQTSELVFAVGPAGTGKTYLAVAVAASMLMAGQVERLILSRPAVEAGERLGFLPGDIRDKVDPYLRPLYDALHDMMPAEQISRRLETGEIEIAPLAFMRGRTLSNAFIILDEAQNTTPMQMKMFLTRFGENARMVVTGDETQVDLPPNVSSGLRDAAMTLRGISAIRFVRLTDADIVRHEIVTKIVQAYAARQQTEQPSGDLFDDL